MTSHIGPLPTFESFLIHRANEVKGFRNKMEKLEFFLEDVERLSQDVEDKYNADLKVSYDENTESIDLNFIGVPDDRQGQGVASKMMEELCKYADEYGLPIRLHANDDLGTSMEVLTKFYKKFGFVDKNKVVKDVGRLMIRPGKR